LWRSEVTKQRSKNATKKSKQRKRILRREPRVHRVHREERELTDATTGSQEIFEEFGGECGGGGIRRARGERRGRSGRGKPLPYREDRLERGTGG
jgi:hypothetical protein